MEPMAAVTHFVAILNPFALCLLMANVASDLDFKDYVRVLVSASLISAVVFWFAAFTGDNFLENIVGVQPEAMRIFGGIIFLGVGYNYATKGYKAAVALRGSVDELPSAIALPFMIGAGTITQAILIGKTLPPVMSASVLLAGVVFSLLVLVVFKIVHDHLIGINERIFDKYMNVLARLNGLLIGAISAEMVVTGVRSLWIG